MDLIKVFDQAVREIKREVNLKVLKVPEIEQKVLDATSDEPWGPHGSALAEIAQGTKKFSECQMIMNVLWTRLTDTGPNWRHVYKALAVIEYLVANGSERAVDDILEHSFQISSISGFEYVEPNGKDVGINVRKKVETILALLNDKEKVQAVRNKAAANRDKYFGLSSTGITYKSNSSHGSSGFHHNERYGGLSGEKDSDTSKDSSKDTERYGEETERNHVNKGSLNKSLEKVASETERKKSKKKVVRHARDKDSLLSGSSTPSTKAGPVSSSKSSSAQPKGSEDDFDDFDPRGSSSTTGSTATNFNQVDLFGESLVGDLLDAPTSIPTETTTLNSAATPEVDLFADSTFVSASPHVEAATGFQTQANVDLFNNQPSFPAAFTSKEDLFAAPNSSLPAENKSPTSEPTNTNTFDPFAGVPLNNFEGSDLFGAFTSHTDPVTKEPSQNSADNSLNNLDQTSSVASKPAPKKETFQVKSGIWADSLSRGLIDLNITAPKKASLADIGVMGGLGDGSDEKEEGPPTSAYMGRAMGAGSGLGRSGFTSSTAIGGNGTFSTLGQPQFGSFK